MDEQQATIDEADWPARTVLFLVLGAFAALAIQQLVEPQDYYYYLERNGIAASRYAWATGIGVAAMAFGFGPARVRMAWTAMFAPALGLVAGLIVWWNGSPQGLWDWSGASLLLAIAIAVPLFQVARDEGARRFPYPQVHGHAWTNVVLWGACWGFTGITLLLSHLLAELFALIGIDSIRTLLNKNWSNAMIIGGAFGAALGLLRDRDRVVRLLQRVVTSVLAVLAPVLGVALLLFILSLPFTGLGNLWEATRETTPILMACLIGALILANAVIGHGPDDEAKNPVLRWSAMALGVSVLPLAIIATIAVKLRLGQYGVTPDRLWGLVVVVFAVAYGLVYLVDLVRGRQGWAPLIRRDNIRLAFATMAVALVLATPLAGFNAISTNDQVARLKAGKVDPNQFDWAALAFDFGEPGRRAVADLQKSTNKTIAARAAGAAAAKSRWELMERPTGDVAVKTYDVKPAGAILPEALKKAILDNGDGCSSTAYCRVYLQAGGTVAVTIGDACMDLPADKRADPATNCAIEPLVFVLANGQWNDSRYYSPPEPKVAKADAAAALKKERDAIDAGKVEVRDVTRKQLFIGDKPIGAPFAQP